MKRAKQEELADRIMDKLINMTGPVRSTYYSQVDQIEHKQVKMIRKRRANRMVGAF